MLRRAGLGLLSVLPFVRPAAAAVAANKPAQLFVLMHRPGMHWDRTKPFDEQPGIADHVAYMRQYFLAGRLIAGGPFLDNSGGMMVLNVHSAAAAAQIAGGDPAVQRGLIQVTVRPWLDVFVR